MTIEETGMDELAKKRTRLAELDRELAGLQAQHDLAMSAFLFDEANALQRKIEPLEDERRALAAALPPFEPTAVSAPGVTRLKMAPRLAWRARRRR